MSNDFFGLQISPGKKYSNEPIEPLRLTMATLGEKVQENSRSCVLMNIGGKEFVICVLIPGQNESQSLDVYVPNQDAVSFRVSGPNEIFLTGYYVPDVFHDDEESDEEINEEIDEESDGDSDVDILEMFRNSGIKLYGDDHMLDDSEDRIQEYDDDEYESRSEEDGFGQIEEIEVQSDVSSGEVEEFVPQKKEKTSKKEEKSKKDNSKKEEKSKKDNSKIEEKSKKDNSKKEQVKPEASETSNLTKKEKKKLLKEQATQAEPKKEEKASNGKRKPEEEPSSKAKKEKKQEEDSSKVKQFPNGLIVEDHVSGTGDLAKNGSKVALRYVGRLTNGKEFDSNRTGKPFSFILGRGEVIKGWDMGINGMKVGGSRKLTIPAPLAYGRNGAPPDIPRNATLVFDVKLLAVHKK